jgi:sugar phosphate isomerase/epimerase
MRFGGPFLGKYTDPESWIKGLKEWGFRATIFPLPIGAPSAEAKAVEKAARAADIVIAEVGVWNNPIDPDPVKRKAALDACKAGLAQADEVGARCCVNCAGTLHPTHWFGPHPENLTSRGMDLVVDSIREIIDAVKPVRTWYTLEPMGFILPDSTENYLEILKAVDRDRFAVHFDPVNLINTPRKYFDNGKVTSEFVRVLGRHIKSVHIKDITLTADLTVNLNEIRAGLGSFDARTFFREINRLDHDMPVLMEHLNSAEDYRLAAEYLRKEMKEAGVNE